MVASRGRVRQGRSRGGVVVQRSRMESIEPGEESVRPAPSIEAAAGLLVQVARRAPSTEPGEEAAAGFGEACVGEKRPSLGLQDPGAFGEKRPSLGLRREAAVAGSSRSRAEERSGRISKVKGAEERSGLAS